MVQIMEGKEDAIILVGSFAETTTKLKSATPSVTTEKLDGIVQTQIPVSVQNSKVEFKMAQIMEGKAAKLKYVALSVTAEKNDGSKESFNEVGGLRGAILAIEPKFITPSSEVNLNFKKAIFVKDKTIIYKDGYYSNSKHKLFKELQSLGMLEDLPTKRIADLRLRNSKGGSSPLAH
ncbi:hypothetical protein MA16_Dca008890 [Dendrobium catenatum]|uniref:Uncharacterized protein n=1 Tax=Dendrobium catenatum TaxID=906689 RepID=A0A2I0VUL8_9ASPA|nr:hypothetical protein MA16_Dca008890 [Dendrobium catenatum]